MITSMICRCRTSVLLVILNLLSTTILTPVASAQSGTVDIFLSQPFEAGNIRGSAQSASSKASISSSDRFNLKIGDDSSNRPYRTILSFDTSAIPDTATIASATLYITSTNTSSRSPLGGLGKTVLEMKSGYFGSQAQLEAQDFAAVVGAKGGSTSKATGTLSFPLPITSLYQINKKGTTQFRLRAKNRTNNDKRRNILKFYSNEAPVASNRPFLRISYGSGTETSAETIWRPAPGTSWQWQLSGSINTSLNVDMYDIDLFTTSASTISALKARGIKVVCYFSAGSYENFRPDAAQFPSSVLGSANGWPGERWLDIRALSTIGPIMAARLDLAVTKGCDGVEPDNVDGYANKSGFPLTPSDQLTYNRWIADQAHARRLSVGLKNDLGQISSLIDSFDWALNEQCFEFDECSKLSPFIQQNKAVFGVEYNLSASSFCSQANQMNFDWLKKNENLDAAVTACR